MELGHDVVEIVVADTWIREVPEWVSRVMIQGPDPWSDMELGPDSSSRYVAATEQGPESMSSA